MRSASESDYRLEVRNAATALMKTKYSPASRSHWSVFRVVDAFADDRPVANTPRFFIGSDGLATMAFSDIRGRISYQHFPAGDYVTGSL